MLLAKSLDLTVTGTSFHVGSGCSELEAYDRAIKKAKNIFKFGELLGYDMDLLDIGGGFPGSDDEKFQKVSLGFKRELNIQIFPLDCGHS